MSDEMLLSKVENDNTVVIRKIINSKLKVKLMEMGLIEGKRIKVLFRAPFGDPIAFDIEGYILSLRIEEANLIVVEPYKPLSK